MNNTDDIDILEQRLADEGYFDAKPNVLLERLEALEEFMLAVLAHAKVNHPPNMCVRRSDVDCLADAIAEIKRLRKDAK